MPMYTYACRTCDHQVDHYFPSFGKAPAFVGVHVYGEEHRLYRIISPSAPAIYFEQGRGRWITNLGPEPVFVTSAKQHQRLMKKNGVTFATNDDLLHNKTRRALDARRTDPHSLKDAFRKAKESL